MRRLFAFLFTHEWENAKGSEQISMGGLGLTVIQECQRCGARTDRYNVLDFEAFQYWFRKRGCPGSRKADALIAALNEDKK